MSEFSSVFTAILQQLGAVLQKQGKPISTLVLLNAMRQRKDCAAAKILKQARLLDLALPAEQEEGDSGIFTVTLERVLVTAELLAGPDAVVGTQHALLAMVKDLQGPTGKWLRDNGLQADSVNWEEHPELAEVKATRSTPWAKPILTTFTLLVFLLIGVFEGPNDPLGILYGFLALWTLPGVLAAWCKSSGWSPQDDKCCRCGRQYELKVMLDKKSGLCRICERSLEGRSGVKFGLTLATLALLSAVSRHLSQPMAYLFTNLLLAAGLCCVATFFHELGHFLMAWLTGHRIFSFHLGRGPIVFCKRVGRIWFYLHAPPYGGMVIALKKNKSLNRLCAILFCLGGPMANLLLAWVCWPHFQASPDWSIHAWTQVIDPIWSFFLINLSMGVANLVPRDLQLEGGQVIGTDGSQILAVLGAGPEGSLKLQQRIDLLLSDIYRSYGNSEAQLDLIRYATTERDREILMREMYLLFRLGRHQEAADLICQLGEPDPHVSPEQSALEANNLAWYHYRVGQIEKAEQLSAQSVSSLPTMPSVLGTRGEVLAAMGQLSEGKDLIWRAVRFTSSAESAALNLHALTRIAALQGDEAEFGRLNAMMLELDPETDRYKSVKAATDDARTRGHAMMDISEGAGPVTSQIAEAVLDR